MLVCALACTQPTSGDRGWTRDRGVYLITSLSFLSGGTRLSWITLGEDKLRMTTSSSVHEAHPIPPHPIICQRILPHLQVALSSLVSRPHRLLQLHPGEGQRCHGCLVHRFRHWKPHQGLGAVTTFSYPNLRSPSQLWKSSDLPGPHNSPTFA